MKKIIFCIILLSLFFTLNPKNIYARMVVGAVEFEARNNINLENASRIIPELLIEQLVKIGKYDVTERILLSKILKEQELAISGIVDTKAAPKVGKIYDLEGVITGSFMKIGDTISISARLIKTETGEVITAGTVKMDDINKLQEKIETLAYLLSGIDRTKMLMRKDIKERKKQKYGIIIGGGYYLCTEYNNNIFTPFMTGMFYTGKYTKLLFTGIPPLTDTAMIETGIDFNLNYYISLGIKYNYLSANGEPNENKKYIDYAEYSTILLGFTFSPMYNLDIGLYMGPMLSATYKIYDENAILQQFKVHNFYNFPPAAFNIHINWSFSKKFGIRYLIILMDGKGKNLTADSNWDEEWIYSSLMSFGLTYRFSF